MNKYVRQALLSIRKFIAALKAAGIKDFHFHDLRPTFASQLAMSGVDLNTIQELLGHSDLKTSLIYAHLSKDHKFRAVKLLGSRIEAPSSEQKTQDQIISATPELAVCN